MPGKIFSSKRNCAMTPGQRTGVARAEMPSVFVRGVLKDNQIDPLLRRYDQTRTLADRDAVIESLLPLVTAIAAKKRARMHCDDELDEMVSDGLLDLTTLVEQYADRSIRHFMATVIIAVRRSMLEGWKLRQWGKYAKSEKMKIAIRFRKQFLRDNGRLATRDEVRTHLATTITNPDMLIIHRKSKMIRFCDGSDGKQVKRATREIADHRELPVDVAVNREILRLALKTLRGKDRTFLSLAIDGMSVIEIAKRLGLTKDQAHQRVNGILWELRCRNDLAMELGVQPSDSKPTRAGDRSHCLSISSAPPAKLLPGMHERNARVA
jgi:RNA polymerase sigma factor (sigma-70 family)